MMYVLALFGCVSVSLGGVFLGGRVRLRSVIKYRFVGYALPFNSSNLKSKISSELGELHIDYWLTEMRRSILFRLYLLHSNLMPFQ